jgi:hypothetical protein
MPRASAPTKQKPNQDAGKCHKHNIVFSRTNPSLDVGWQHQAPPLLRWLDMYSMRARMKKTGVAS